jgi:hypothetical protein
MPVEAPVISASGTLETYSIVISFEAANAAPVPTDRG